MTIPRTHQERVRLAEKFTDYWNAELGHLFEVPDRNQIFTWLGMGGWDFSLLEECILDLRSRASQTPAMNAADPHLHGMKHFSATLIRKTRQKYGKVRPMDVAA